jgi:hypothetical protein
LIRYRLEAGEQFSIEGLAHRRCNYVVPLGAGRLPVMDLSVRFVLDCHVTGVDQANDMCSIACCMSQVEAEGTVWKLPLSLGLSGQILGGTPVKHVLSKLREAVGDKFTVQKSLFGPIQSVDGGERAARAMGGMSLQAGLTWYGASFPRHASKFGESWLEEINFEMGADFLGLVGPHRHGVRLGCEYKPTGWTEGDVVFPRFQQQLQFEGVSSLGWGLGLRLKTSGKGKGEVVANTDTGKIYRSRKDAKLTTQIQGLGSGLSIGRLEVEIDTDSYHV